MRQVNIDNLPQGDSARFAIKLRSEGAHSSLASASKENMKRPAGFYERYGKRPFDIFGALVFLLIFSPLFAVIFLLLLVQRGPVIFAHDRVGKNGRIFRCLKFCTMVPDAGERLQSLLASDPDARRQWQKEQKLDDDPRVTPLGSILRRSSLDELPQLLNVLRGEMSLVGPRPVTKNELPRYGDMVECYLALQPGLTGLWQVSGRNETGYAARVAMDVAYARHITLFGDLTILVRTVGAVLCATGK